MNLRPNILLSGVALLATAGCTGKLERDASAVILAVDGIVQVESSDRTIMLEAGAGTKVEAGKTIRTNPGASASIFILPGALVEVQPATTLKVNHIALAKNGNATDEAMSRDVHLSVSAGTVDLVLQFESNADAVRIETPHGTLTAGRRGTCRLTVERESARLTCLRGTFDFVRSDGGRRSITAGSFQDLSSATLETFPAEGDARAQQDMEQILEVERKLLVLQKKARAQPFPWRAFDVRDLRNDQK